MRLARLVAAAFFALCLDPVVLRAAGPVVTVTSMNPDSGVWMTPCCGMNVCAQFVESTPFTISCPGGTPVRLEAPATVGETPFTEWRRPGSLPYTIDPTFIILPDADVTITVVYGDPVEPLPDFAVTGITLTPASPITGLTFSAQVTVTNQGAAANTYDGWLDIWTDRAAAAGCGIYSTTSRGFGRLAPGAGRVLTFNGLTAGPAGAATFRAFAEVDCLIEEADETNNEATLAYTVRPRKILSVSSVNPASAAIQVSPNDLVGQANGTAPFSRSYDPGAVVSLTAPADVGGYVFQKWRRDGLDFATTHSVEVTMDADHNLVAVYVRPPSPDFWVSSITVMPTQPTAGYAFSASITVQNRGNAGGYGGSLAVWANKLFNSTCTRYESGMCLEYTPSCNWHEADQGLQVGTLAAGESRTFVFSGLGPLAQGSAFYLRAYVDAECETSEGVNGDLEGDNQRTRNYVVIPGTTHSLSVGTLDGRAAQIAHSMDVSGQTTGMTPFTRNFRAGATVTLTAPPTTPGGGVFQKWVGLEPVVPMTPEVTFTMNSGEGVQAVYIGPGTPDFAVTGLVIDPPNPPAGGTFSATVTITNIGTGRGVPGGLDLFPDKSTPANCWAGSMYGPMFIYDLAAGASLTYTIPSIPAGALGAKTLLAFVESFCQTDEPDEANNQLFLPYEAVSFPPETKNDSYAAVEGGTLSPAAPGVLGNDTFVEGGTLQAVKILDPAHGTLTLNANGSFTYVHDGSETTNDSFTYKANDGSADSNTATVTITVTPLNDTPSFTAISPLTIDEDGGPQTVALSGISAGGGESQTLTVTATSSDTGLIPHPTVTYTSPNATGSLDFTPVTNANGTATITVTVNDSQAANTTAVQTFLVTVNAVNDPPTLEAIGNVTINQDAGVQTVGLSGIAAGGGENQTLTVTAVSSNPGLIPNPTVTYSSPDVTGSLAFTPMLNAAGTATITVIVDDGEAAANSIVQTFLVTVEPLPYVLWTRSDSGRASLWQVDPSLPTGPSQLKRSVNLYAASGIGAPWQASSYTHVSATEGYVLWTRSDNGRAVLWQIDPSLPTGPSQIKRAVSIYSPSGIGALWQASSYTQVSATEGYVLWTRSVNGRAALWQIDPSLPTGPGQLKRSVNLYSASGIGAPWQATSYTHLSATEGYVLWTRSDNGKAALWQIDPSLPAGPSQLKRSVLLYSASGVGAPWLATSYTHVSATEGFVLWTRRDSGRAALWQIDPSLPTGPSQLKSSVVLYSASGVGAAWQATALAITGGLANGAGADVLDTSYNAGQGIDTPASDAALADSVDGVMVR